MSTKTQESAGHTPGPWRVVHHNDDTNRVVVFGICEVWSTSRGTEAKLANARLIAAAPELLEALKLADEWLDELIAEHSVRLTELGRSKRDLIRAAITKATGQQS